MSISKAIIKEIKALQQPKYRQMYNKFVAEGEKACLEFVKNEKYHIHLALYIDPSHAVSQMRSKLPPDKVFEVSHKEMEQMTGLKAPSNVLLVMERREDDRAAIHKNETKIIYLDGVQDPGNTGTIIRIADWFGIDAVVRSADSADFFNPKVVQATMGSMNNVVLFTAPLDEALCAGRHIAGTFMQGTPLRDNLLKENTILVLGSEGRGISESSTEFITDRISIPGVSGRIADSLNVAIAAGIICAAWSRQ